MRKALLYLGFLLYVCASYSHAYSPKEPCETCKKLVERFHKGLEDTAKKNFGGGNTAWEEKTLSKYEISEIRLVEIIDNLCDSSDFECNRMVEEHEEQIEKWWFKMKKKHSDLLKWFCIDTIEVCCPSGTYGPDCLACHQACKTCTGATNNDCQICKEGWTKTNEEACVDVDECAVEDPPCKDNEYCLNSEGSYSCKACDQSCTGCTGGGADECKNCTSGYTLQEDTCADINECETGEKLCFRENEDCINTPGSYKCACSEGFEDKDGECTQNETEVVEAQPDEELQTEPEDSNNQHEDL